MANAVPVKLNAATAGEIAAQFKLDTAAEKLFEPALKPEQFVERLLEKDCCVDAVKCIAYALPKREAVWWACLCVRRAGPSPLPAPAQKAVQAAEKWVADPSDANRTATLDAAKAAEFASPAGCAALAAYWSGGKHAPADAKLNPPAERWTHHAVSGAITQAAVAAGPADLLKTLRTFVGIGLEVMRGSQRWK